MTITLYNCTSASNVLNKSMSIVQTGISATAKGPVDVDSPSIILAYSSFDFNYFYISDFNRYYYVTGRSLEPGGHIRLSGRSDPLQSAAAELMELDCLAVRNEDINKWDKNEPDPAILTKSKRVTRGYSFGSMQDVHSNTDATYILGVI